VTRLSPRGGLPRSTRAAASVARRSWRDTPRRGRESRDPRPAAAAGCPDARSRAAADANDCGPLRTTDTSGRSVPSAGGPLSCPSRSCPRARNDGAGPGLGSDEGRTLARAGEPAASAPMASGAPVLRRERHSQPLPALLPPPRQYRAPPATGHPGAKSMLVDPALVPGPIRRLHSRTPPSEPRKLVGKEG
jgi:hypothetical protein